MVRANKAPLSAKGFFVSLPHPIGAGRSVARKP
jgi:hypothetical protein